VNKSVMIADAIIMITITNTVTTITTMITVFIQHGTMGNMKAKAKAGALAKVMPDTINMTAV